MPNTRFEPGTPGSNPTIRNLGDGGREAAAAVAGEAAVGVGSGEDQYRGPNSHWPQGDALVTAHCPGPEAERSLPGYKIPLAHQQSYGEGLDKYNRQIPALEAILRQPLHSPPPKDTLREMSCSLVEREFPYRQI
ncbi:hypothetical protein J6590_049415 [Homalodisca vitripennis]|nr:hypothetical protein J6590_049415 [Homalodisca vitripennis]